MESRDQDLANQAEGVIAATKYAREHSRPTDVYADATTISTAADILRQAQARRPSDPVLKGIVLDRPAEWSAVHTAMEVVKRTFSFESAVYQ